MEYKIKNIALNVDNLDEMQFPSIKDRTIEKYGDVVEFTFNEVEENRKAFVKKQTELLAQIKYEQMAIDNVEEHHPFVKDVSDEDLTTYWVYKKFKGEHEAHSKLLKQVEDALADLDAEIEDMLKQIPELSVEEKNEENA